MAKKKQSLALSPRVFVRAGLVFAGVTVAVFVLQSLALWLPFRWAYQFAANATVWSVLQFGLVVTLGLISIALGLMRLPKTSLALGAIAFIGLMPTVQMIAGLRQYAAAHDIALSPTAQTQLFRTSYAPEADVVYGHAGGTELELTHYLTPHMKGTIVYIHGGGWSGGSRTENSDLFRWFNSLGYNVHSIDYRVARDGYATWKDAPRDVACALSWLAHKRHGPVTLMGDSAGGQLALRTAYGLKNGDVTSSCDGSPLVPDRVVGIVPAVDFYELYDDPKIGPTSRENVVRYLGGTPSSVPQAYVDASIYTHVRPGLMPTLLINADNDTLVSARSGEALAARLREAGVSVEQYTLPYTVHSYWINPGGYQSQLSRAIIARFLEQDNEPVHAPTE